MKIYNTMERKKIDFTPITPGAVKMYTCGQTVYNHIHMGNARFYVVYDAIRRYLEHRGYAVEYVQNFTDIDDKTIARAAEEGITTLEIADKYIASTLEDLQNLNVLPATYNPRVTEEMPEIIEMISQLISSGHAYENAGTVYFHVPSFPNYGKLSHKNIDELEAGARIEVEEGKKHPSDFVLWKPAKPGEPSWTSPWGEGRPGWHIECSAMIRKYLGEQIDIHGGGTDLIFPHHENEIAQTEALTGADMARYWLHCDMITVEHKKMSKSRGNFQTLREAAENFPYDVLRFFFLSAHYRMPMEFTAEVVAAAGQGLQRIKNCYANVKHALKVPGAVDQSLDAYVQEFNRAMDDDFNTADAIAAIFQMVSEINIHLSGGAHCPNFLHTAQHKLCELISVLGFSLEDEEEHDSDFTAQVEALIAARTAAKKEKNFAEADRIRGELTDMGVVLEDTREGVRWHRA